MRETTIPVTGTAGLQATIHEAKSEAARAAVVLVHGFAEHSGRYTRMIDFLTSRGLHVATYDLRGHGSAPGRRAQVRVDQHVRDNLAVRDAVDHWYRSAHGAGAGSLPNLLMGHSMGGLVAAESAILRPSDLTGLILSSPALVVGEKTPAPVRLIAPVVARLLPFLPVEKLDPSHISRDPGYVADYVADPLVHHKAVPAATGGTLVGDGARMLDRCRSISTPTLLLNGSADAIVSARGARRFAAVAGSDHDPRPEITYREFEDGFHELFNDLCADEAYAALGEWIDGRLG